MTPLSSAAKSALRRFLAGDQMRRMRESVTEELSDYGFLIQCELGATDGGIRPRTRILSGLAANRYGAWRQGRVAGLVRAGSRRSPGSVKLPGFRRYAENAENAESPNIRMIGVIQVIHVKP